VIIIAPAPVLVPDTFFVTFIVVFTLAIVPIAMSALPGPAGPGPARCVSVPARCVSLPALRVAPGDQTAGIGRSVVRRVGPTTDSFASGGRHGHGRPGRARA